MSSLKDDVDWVVVEVVYWVQYWVQWLVNYFGLGIPVGPHIVWFLLLFCRSWKFLDQEVRPRLVL